MSFIPLPTRNEVITRLVKDKNKAHGEALKCVSDKINKATALPIHFDLVELGPDADVQRKIIEALEYAGWKCTSVMDSEGLGKKLMGYNVE